MGLWPEPPVGGRFGRSCIKPLLSPQTTTRMCKVLAGQRRKDGKLRNAVIMAVARKLVMTADALCKSC